MADLETRVSGTPFVILSRDMDDIHISRELLRAVDEGRVPLDVLDAIKTEHLLSRCPHCRAEVEAFKADRRVRASAFSRFLRIVSALLGRLVALGSGEMRRAERDFRELLLLQLRQGRTADVQRLAEEMLPVFQTQDVHREALAALALFQEAARQDRLTLVKARQVAAFLREARTEPALRFAWHS